MSTEYACNICEYKTVQKSHIDSHLKKKNHELKKTIKKLELEKLENNVKIEQYGTDNIEEILRNMECIKTDKKKMKKIVKKNEKLNSKKTIDGTILWNLENNHDLNTNYISIKSKLDSIIKQCHNLLYSKGGSIVGTKAQNDIMRILCLKILQSQFNDENSELWEI